MNNVKLINKFIVAFLVVIGLCSGYGPMVFYQGLQKIKDAIPHADPQVLVLLDQLQKSAVTVGVLGAVLGFIVCFFLIKQVITPISAINLGLKSYLVDGKPVQVRIPNKDEIGVTALFVNQLIGKETDN